MVDVAVAPLADPLQEARRVVDAAANGEVLLRLTGGVAIACISPSARVPPLWREYGDIDFVGTHKQVAAIEDLFASLGYVPEEEFNNLHGERRLFFQDHAHHREADVFLDAIHACHSLPLRARLTLNELALSPADLLLSKLQVIQTTDKDYRDAIALLIDHPVTANDETEGISLARICEMCGADWGWWRTVTIVADRTLAVVAPMVERGEVPAHAAARLHEIIDALEHTPKSRKWKLRSRVGERVRWHEEPEALDHTHG